MVHFLSFILFFHWLVIGNEELVVIYSLDVQGASQVPYLEILGTFSLAIGAAVRDVIESAFDLKVVLLLLSPRVLPVEAWGSTFKILSHIEDRSLFTAVKSCTSFKPCI